MFLVYRQNPLLLAGELIEAFRLKNLAITRRMNVFANCIKNQFAHKFAQFTELTAISVYENEITLGFEKPSDVQDVAIEHLHVCIGQDQ